MSHASDPMLRQGCSAGINLGSRLAVLLATIILVAVSCSPEASQPEPQAATTPSVSPGASATDSSPASSAPPWQRLENDGLHDPSNPALNLLQQPAEALSELPPAKDGNQVDWVAALREEVITPRTNIYPETKIKVLDLDILMERTAGMPMVLFPHRAHTEWLDCENCHDKIFKAKQGANPVNMFAILQGEYCGQCHGAVSFPLTQCYRCHSVPRASAPAPSGS